MIRNNRPYTNENGWEDKTLITDKDGATQAEVREWINANVLKRKRVNHYHTSYGLKHILEHDTGIYLTNNEFKDAMYLAGFLPVDENAFNWKYRFVLKSEMKKRNPSRFYKFARGYRHAKDPMGDFARDMIHDDEFPTEADKDVIIRYLERLGACQGAMDAFEELWEEYEMV